MRVKWLECVTSTLINHGHYAAYTDVPCYTMHLINQLIKQLPSDYKNVDIFIS
jgi:hypothetical protein